MDAVEGKNTKDIGVPVRDDLVKDKDEEDEAGEIHPDIALILSTPSLEFILASSKHIQSSRVDCVIFDFNLAFFGVDMIEDGKNIGFTLLKVTCDDNFQSCWVGYPTC